MIKGRVRQKSKDPVHVLDEAEKELDVNPRATPSRRLNILCALHLPRRPRASPRPKSSPPPGTPSSSATKNATAPPWGRSGPTSSPPSATSSAAATSPPVSSASTAPTTATLTQNENRREISQSRQISAFCGAFFLSAFQFSAFQLYPDQLPMTSATTIPSVRRRSEAVSMRVRGPSHRFRSGTILILLAR